MYRFLSQNGRACPDRDKRLRSAGELRAHRATARDEDPTPTTTEGFHVRNRWKLRAAAVGYPELHLHPRRNSAATQPPSGNEKPKCRKTARDHTGSTSRLVGLKPKSNPSEMVIISLTTRMSDSPTEGTPTP